MRDRYLQVHPPAQVPLVDGIKYHSELQLSQLLYKIGFINGHRSEHQDKEFIYFEERPDLLEVETNIDDGVTWEVQPSYRNVLNIRQPVIESDRELQK